ncbi:hypothetical protein P4571_07840 [Niallia alba]|uniref:hypothetical protein n=1 Tax=Niallia alba TaxID=2729105 RepID=UPI002E23D3FE|nr:hypothetical protein [Niallia alba]
MSQLYFQEVVENLTVEDIFLLQYLEERGRDEKYKSISRKLLYEELYAKQSEMTETITRKTINRLEALRFISIVNSGRKQKVFITEMGLRALEN